MIESANKIDDRMREIFSMMSRNDMRYYMYRVKRQMQDVFGYNVWEHDPVLPIPQRMRYIMRFAPRMLTPCAGVVFRLYCKQ
jgi:hypothetical protein